MGVLAVAEGHQARAAEAALLHRGDQRGARRVLPGALQRLDEGVGLGHPVLDVALERGLGNVLVVDLPEQRDPAVGGVVGRRQVAVGDHAVDQGGAVRAAARLLGEGLQQAGQGDRVGTDVGHGHLRVVVELERGQLEQRGVGRDGEQHGDVRLGGGDGGDLRAHVGVAGLVALPADHLAGRDVLVEAGDAVLPEVVVLVEVGDLLAGEVVLDVLAEDLAFDQVVGLPAERLLVLGGFVPAPAARGDEQVRHPLAVEEVHDLGVGRGAQSAHHREDVVLEDEFLGHLDGLGRVVAVVLVTEVDLAAVDAAVGVDVVEVRLGAHRDVAVAGRGRAGQRLVAADDDAVLGDTRRRSAVR